MFENLNAICIALLLVVTFTAATLQQRCGLDLKKISDGTNNVLEFLSYISKWIYYLINLKYDIQRLENKRERLQQRAHDLRTHVENQESQTNRKRKMEVRTWLKHAESKYEEVEKMLKDLEQETNILWKFLRLASQGDQVERKIEEVDDLYSSGVFEEVLSCVREAVELVVTPLVGKAVNESVITILDWLGGGVTDIGVFGRGGIGKTAIMKHVHNRLLNDGLNGDVYVYMIQVPEDCSADRLQGLIAEDAGMDLQEKNVLKRAALLKRALERRKFVLILDGLGGYYSVNDIGIPLDPERGKMIVTSHSQPVTQRMATQIIAVNPLLQDEASRLFDQNLDLNEQLADEIEDIKMEIVKQCGGVPRKIIDTSNGLRRVHDINVWESTLRDMLVANE